MNCLWYQIFFLSHLYHLHGKYIKKIIENKQEKELLKLTDVECRNSVVFNDCECDVFALHLKRLSAAFRPDLTSQDPKMSMSFLFSFETEHNFTQTRQNGSSHSSMLSFCTLYQTFQ